MKKVVELQRLNLLPFMDFASFFHSNFFEGIHNEILAIMKELE